MNKANVLSIILPCHNEEAAIRPVLELLLQYVPKLRNELHLEKVQVLVIDDASTDKSSNYLDAFRTEVKILTNTRRLGYGGAIKRGMEFAEGQLIAIYDLDYTYHPSELLQLVQILRNKNLDLICGNRLHNLKNMPVTRQLGNFFFRFLIRNLFRRDIEDSCTGQRVFRSTYAPLLRKILPDRLNFSLAMTIFFLYFQIPFAEVPIQYNRRLGRSKLSVIRDGILFYGTIVMYWGRFKVQSLFFTQIHPLKKIRWEETN